jgi:hypothetical protein
VCGDVILVRDDVYAAAGSIWFAVENLRFATQEEEEKKSVRRTDGLAIPGSTRETEADDRVSASHR